MSIEMVPFLDVLRDATSGNVRSKTNDYLDSGRYPVVDQGQDLIAGYVNDRELVCKSAPPVIVFGDHTKTFKYVDFEFAIGADGTKVLEPKVDADLRYLYYALGRLRLPDVGYSRHFKFLKECEIPLPPLPEQKRIAAILDAADALRTKRRESLEQLDELVQSVFLDMFGDPVTNPKGWETPAIKEVAKTGSGTTPSRKREAEFYGGNTPWVKSGELRESVVTETEESVTEAALAGTSLKLVPADALLIAMYGATVGRMGILGVPATTNQAICHLVFDPSRCRTEFAFHCLRLQVDQLVSMGKGGAQPNINQQIIKAYPLMLPPVEEQNRFVGAVTQVRKIRQAAESHLAELDTLFASLQSRAFRGEL